jgi:hypothetical protein
MLNVNAPEIEFILAAQISYLDLSDSQFVFLF